MNPLYPFPFQFGINFNPTGIDRSESCPTNGHQGKDRHR
jgi:hypothetical protein